MRKKEVPDAKTTVRAFLIDPTNPCRNSDGIVARSAQARELFELARNGKPGSVVVHHSQQCAGLLCLNGVRSLEYFEGALDQFQGIISELFPLNTKGVLLEIPVSSENLPYDDAVRIAGKYFLCDHTGKPVSPLFTIIQARIAPSSRTL